MTKSPQGLKLLAMKSTPLEKYRYLTHLRATNVHLFYRLLAENIKVRSCPYLSSVARVVDLSQDLTPVIYTPTVGEACIRWSEMYAQPEGSSER